MFLDEYQIRYHREKLFKEAERARLISQVRRRATRKGFSYTLAFAWLGSRMCHWGTRLEQRFGDAETVILSQSMNGGS